MTCVVDWTLETNSLPPFSHSLSPLSLIPCLSSSLFSHFTFQWWYLGLLHEGLQVQLLSAYSVIKFLSWECCQSVSCDFLQVDRSVHQHSAGWVCSARCVLLGSSSRKQQVSQHLFVDLTQGVCARTYRQVFKEMSYLSRSGLFMGKMAYISFMLSFHGRT